MRTKKESIKDYLFYDFTEPIRDPIWQNIYLSSGIKAITQSRSFQSLAGIKQLGPAYQVYPGATHTRLNHSLGVFHIARRIITRFLTLEETPDFSLEGINSFLIAALLHDIGHFPYAHSLKELPLKEHEEISAELILEGELAGIIREKAMVDPILVASIVDQGLDTGGRSELEFYRKLLSGVLDPDKLDYLNRDAFFCGVPYGTQDTDFYIDKIIYSKGELALLEPGITAIENILFSKYLMYKTVYWHKTVRIATGMIKKAVALALGEGVLKASQLYGLDDDDFYKTVDMPEFPPLELIQRVFRRDLYKMAYETHFSPQIHGKLMDLSERFALEEKLAKALGEQSSRPWSPQEVIIDIPEAISFEVDLQVKKGDRICSFRDSESAFSPEVVENFTHSLRKVRIFIPRERFENVYTKILSSLLDETL